jgi:radical SAM superfamily enzyme YgiQ (UPF0313 family)
MHVALIGAELEENLAVRYLRGALEDAGHEVTQIVFDGPADLERAAAELACSRAPLAGMSMVFTRRALEFVELGKRARALGYAGHITAGGHFAAFNAESLIRDVPILDSIAIGEGEAILLSLVSHLDDLAAVNGLVWRDADGCPRRNAAATKLVDLDELPWPTRKRPYFRYLGLPIVNMLSGRGCAHHCDFCSITAWHKMSGGARLRMRSPECVAEEMAALYDDGVRIFNFHDDNFLIPNRRLTLERLDRLEAALTERGVGRIAFAIKARPDEVDRELFARLKRMGLFRVFLGIEAGSADSLLRLGRGQLLSDNERALEVMNDLDLHACFNLLLWNPDSTLEDVAQNVAFLGTHARNPMNFCRTEIYAGTPLEARMRERGALIGSYWGWDYRMTDTRAEESFVLALAAFEQRNYGAESVHHWAMRLDYELQLLGHFFAPDERLHKRVKAFVVEVNLDTCAHLTTIVRAVGRGLADRAAFKQQMIETVHARDRELDELAQDILDDLHDAAQRRPLRGAWAQRAAAAGLAATLSLGTAGCPADSHPATYPTETIPVPTLPIVPPTPEPTPTPEPPPSGAQLIPIPPQPGVPIGAPSAIRAAFDASMLPQLAERLRPARDLTVELTLDAYGRVVAADLQTTGLTPALRDRLLRRMQEQQFAGADVVGHRFTLAVTAAELEAARTPTHMHERVPPPTHPSEMIAPPHMAEAAPRPQRPPDNGYISEMAAQPPERGES